MRRIIRFSSIGLTDLSLRLSHRAKSMRSCKLELCLAKFFTLLFLYWIAKGDMFAIFQKFTGLKICQFYFRRGRYKIIQLDSMNYLCPKKKRFLESLSPLRQVIWTLHFHMSC